MVSIGPPGGNGTIIRIGRSGYLPCPRASRIAGDANATPAIAVSRLRLVAIRCPPEHGSSAFDDILPPETLHLSPITPYRADKRGCRRNAVRQGGLLPAARAHRGRPRAHAAPPASPAPSKATSPPCSRP